jgi:hypothetical protein
MMHGPEIKRVIDHEGNAYGDRTVTLSLGASQLTTFAGESKTLPRSRSAKRFIGSAGADQ